MEAFVRTTGIAAAIMRDNIDTDQIAPGRYAPNTPREQHAKVLFRNLRYVNGEPPNEKPDFVLNREPWKAAEILVAGENFGCGSSREAAAKALRAFGFRAIIAASFGGIIFNNCFRNGILPVALPKDVVAKLAQDADRAGEGARVTVDLENLSVTDNAGNAYSFTVPDQQRMMLLKGLDEIDYTLSMREELDAFWQKDALKRPWVYTPGLNLG